MEVLFDKPRVPLYCGAPSVPLPLGPCVRPPITSHECISQHHPGSLRRDGLQKEITNSQCDENDHNRHHQATHAGTRRGRLTHRELVLRHLHNLILHVLYITTLFPHPSVIPAEEERKKRGEFVPQRHQCTWVPSRPRLPLNDPHRRIPR